MKMGKNTYTQEQIDQIYTLLESKTFEQSTLKAKCKLISNTLECIEKRNILKYLINIDLNNN